MAMTTTVDSSHLHLDSVPLVDLRFLSQSELNSFSLCSSSGHHSSSSSDDLVVPKIDRSLFNESAGSRKQTYSRLRLAPRKPQLLPNSTTTATTTAATTTIRRRRGRPSAASLLSVPVADDPERRENSLIVSLLRDMLGRSKTSAPAIAVKKRSRDSEEKFYQNRCSRLVSIKERVDDLGTEIVNKNGVVVDLNALAAVGDPFGPELKRRTVGLETEEGLLAFLRGLEGHWGSRRKRRKIVDASMFGDALPIGWKILLSLKRKEGRVWLYCRRYIRFYFYCCSTLFSL